MDTGQLEDPIPADAWETLPARYYTDRDIFAEETEKILAGTWHLVGHRSRVAKKGDLKAFNDLYLRHMSGPDT